MIAWTTAAYALNLAEVSCSAVNAWSACALVPKLAALRMPSAGVKEISERFPTLPYR